MIWLWVGFFALVGALLALDLGVFHRRSHALSLREALGWSAVWIALGLGFSGVVYLIYEGHWLGAALAHAPDQRAPGGGPAVALYLTAYLLEKSLSVDNIFVMAMLFSSFRVPARQQHRVLFWGILGALVLRGAMIGGGVWLVSRFTWIFYVFGAYLAYAGLKLGYEGLRSPAEAAEERVVGRAERLLRKTLPMATVDLAAVEREGRFVTREGGRLVFTELFLALVAIELTDVVFAVDSIPAVLAITTDSFIVVTSNVFAILGLRALYFVLADMIDRFRYLKLSLAVLLIYIGAKMILHSWVKIPTLLSLGIIVGLVALGVVASVARADHRDQTPGPT